MTAPSTSHNLSSLVLKELRLDGPNVAINKTTDASSKTLCRHVDFPPFDDHFNDRRVIGQLNYLKRSVQDWTYLVQ
jgi:hypothetical protein